jgi:hypothetical protein
MVLRWADSAGLFLRSKAASSFSMKSFYQAWNRVG